MSEEIMISGFLVRDFKKFLEGCKKICNKSKITLRPDGFFVSCEEYFKIEGKAPKEKIDVLNITKEHNICNIDTDDISKLIKRKNVEKIKMRPKDGTLETAFFDDMGKFMFSSEIGQKC